MCTALLSPPARTRNAPRPLNFLLLLRKRDTSRLPPPPPALAATHTLLRVFPRPFSCHFFVSRSVSLVDMRNFWHQRVVGVGIRQQRTNGQQHLGDGEGRRPLLLEDVQANGALRIDVWVVYFGLELYFRWLKGVIRREMNGDEKDAAAVGTVCGAHDGRLGKESRKNRWWWWGNMLAMMLMMMLFFNRGCDRQGWRDAEKEKTAGSGAVGGWLSTYLPVEEVISGWPSAAGSWWILLQVL
jgi:hypothetical protein